ncbi:hypothetical protein K402DRAFT_45476 [Aulographum hederae CBS 113979]|uniref:Uncharacterized protein n=1 Tax=Aulographum hederae CBS 113979 TaxID=1176131 RepID=A0A6G1H486_9PEZI|nr:hypothetical protein K402DRAFT_45476 [Aulographum hederae CBS 113979]
MRTSASIISILFGTGEMRNSEGLHILFAHALGLLSLCRRLPWCLHKSFASLSMDPASAFYLARCATLSPLPITEKLEFYIQ